MAMNTGYIVGFAGAICLVCSLGVGAASQLLKPQIQANELNAFQKKLLAAVEIPTVDEAGQVLPPEQVEALFKERLKLVVVDSEGNEALADKTDDEKLAAVADARAKVKGTPDSPALSPVYLRKDGETTAAYAIELQGKGLWGPISGYLALKPDGREVMSVAFDAPKETPGLGAEIMKDKFKDQWKTKSIAKGANLVPIAVEKSCAGKDAAHCVDGVSGATITSNGVDEMVERAVTTEYKNYLSKINKAGG